MRQFLEISTSLYTKSLTLFVGTGFSKYLTNNNAPSWLELIAEAVKIIDTNNELTAQLFNLNADGEVVNSIHELTVCAQILEAEYSSRGKNLKEEIAEIVRSRINEDTIDKDKLAKLHEFFAKYPDINIITTNYDTIFSDYVMPFTSRIFIEGSPIPRINTGQNIYHIHGCVNKPESIVLTLKDYYKFQNSSNYFSRKFYTLLQETTVVVLGYSLGDFNLNTILSDGNTSKRNSFRTTDVYYVSKREVSPIIKQFYEQTYGISVIENHEINELFEEIESNIDTAKEMIDSVQNLNKVLEGKAIYKDDFLKLNISLSKVLIQAGSLGIESGDINFLKFLIDTLERKRGFTTEYGAWDQYSQYADWLVQVASIVVIKGTEIEKEFCELARYSIAHSSRKQVWAYSWGAWWNWYTQWRDMKIDNQIMLRDYIKTQTWDAVCRANELYEKMPI